MQQTRTQQPDHPLRHLTAAQFMALGGNAVVYVKQLKGEHLAAMLPNAELEEDADFHVVVSADGSPLMVGDSAESVAEWLSDKQFGIVALH